MGVLSSKFGVSKPIISDDVAIINAAFKEEGVGRIMVDRGRDGGTRFVPVINSTRRSQWLKSLSQLLADPKRRLPGGLIHYSDLIFNPLYASMLGAIIASDFSDIGANVVMTSEMKGIPIALFAAHVLGVSLAVCRFRNRPSDGPAVAVHFPTTHNDVRTMYMATQLLPRDSRVLVVDDFMRGGSTASGMHLIAAEFGAKVVGTGIFIAATEPEKKAVSDYRALFHLSDEGIVPATSLDDEED